MQTLSGRRFPLVGQAPAPRPSSPGHKRPAFSAGPPGPPKAGGFLGRGLPRCITTLLALDHATLVLMLLWLILFLCLLFCLSPPPPLRRLEGERPESLQECSRFPYFFFFFLSLSWPDLIPSFPRSVRLLRKPAAEWKPVAKVTIEPQKFDRVPSLHPMSHG